jgi:hypothetical protein
MSLTGFGLQAKADYDTISDRQIAATVDESGHLHDIEDCSRFGTISRTFAFRAPAPARPPRSFQTSSLGASDPVTDDSWN